MNAEIFSTTFKATYRATGDGNFFLAKQGKSELTQNEKHGQLVTYEEFIEDINRAVKITKTDSTQLTRRFRDEHRLEGHFVLFRLYCAMREMGYDHLSLIR